MHSEPQQEHRWLQKLIGEWTTEHTAPTAPDASAENMQGRESVRSLGDLWVLCEGEGEMPGGGIARSLMTLGYDPTRQRFVGSFVASMMTHLWVYEGELDAAGKVLTLNTVGPKFDGEGMANYRDVIEFHDDNYRTLSAYVQDDNGQWQRMFVAHYRRK